VAPQLKTARARHNVIGRYLTLAGAALSDPALCVSITETGPRTGEILHSTVATCAGCTDSDSTAWSDGSYGDDGSFIPTPRASAIKAAEVTARAWAHSHAETCRAMPPTQGETPWSSWSSS
jgi:hypothetical protein